MYFSFSAVYENADENEIPFMAENETKTKMDIHFRSKTKMKSPDNIGGISLDIISNREQFAFLVCCYRVKAIFHNLRNVLYWRLFRLH